MLYIAEFIYFLTIIFGIFNLISAIQRVLHYRTVALIHGLLTAAGLLLALPKEIGFATSIDFNLKDEPGINASKLLIESPNLQ